MKLQQAILQRWRKIAEKIAWRGFVFIFLLSSHAFAADQARINLNVAVRGIARVLNLTAVQSATPGAIALSWTEPAARATTDPRRYDIRVSTAGQISDDAAFDSARPLSDFSPVPIPAPGPGGGLAAMLVTGLEPGKVHYFAVREHDSGTPMSVGAWLRSAARGWNADNFAIPLGGKLPMEPYGLRLARSADGSSVTFSWAPTRQFSDASPFSSTGTPAADELLGYVILRSTDICVAASSFLSSATVDASSVTDVIDPGEVYYYRIHSYNSWGRSPDVFVLSSDGGQNFFVEGCLSRYTIQDEAAAALSRASNGLGADIRIARRRRTEDIGGRIFESVEFKAMKNGVTEMPGFHFDRPGRVVLHYSTGTGGAPVPVALSVGGKDGGPLPAAADAKNLGIYWNNGAQYKKLYGKVDAAAQSVSVETPNLGPFQIRSLQRSNGAVFDLSNLSSRVITPNNDGLNDVLIFTYDPGPGQVVPVGRIYDLKGLFVADMAPGLAPDTLTWDGKMGGKPAAGGVYVYEIKGDGKTFNGTIVLAR